MLHNDSLAFRASSEVGLKRLLLMRIRPWCLLFLWAPPKTHQWVSLLHWVTCSSITHTHTHTGLLPLQHQMWMNDLCVGLTSAFSDSHFVFKNKSLHHVWKCAGCNFCLEPNAWKLLGSSFSVNQHISLMFAVISHWCLFSSWGKSRGYSGYRI